MHAGPCKLIAPQVEAMAATYKGQGVRFAKVDCTAEMELLQTTNHKKGRARHDFPADSGSEILHGRWTSWSCPTVDSAWPLRRPRNAQAHWQHLEPPSLEPPLLIRVIVPTTTSRGLAWGRTRTGSAFGAWAPPSRNGDSDRTFSY